MNKAAAIGIASRHSGQTNTESDPADPAAAAAAAATADQYITVLPSPSPSLDDTGGPSRRQGYRPPTTPDVGHVDHLPALKKEEAAAGVAGNAQSRAGGPRVADMQSAGSSSLDAGADIAARRQRGRSLVAANTAAAASLHLANQDRSSHGIGTTTTSTSTSTLAAAAAVSHGLPHTSIHAAQPSPELSPTNPFKFPFKAAAYESDSDYTATTASTTSADMRTSSSNMSTGSSTFYDSSVSSSPLLMQQPQQQPHTNTGHHPQQQHAQHRHHESDRHHESTRHHESHRHHESASHRRAIPSLSSAVPPVTSPIVGKYMPYSAVHLGPGNSTTSFPGRPCQQSFWDTPTAWIVYYFVANLSLTLYNKLMMDKFPFPWALTGIHTLCGTIGSQIALSKGLFTQQRLTGSETIVLIAFSSLYTINIAVSNLSLNLVTVPFHQVVRAMTPLFTILLSAILLKKQSTKAVYISLVPIVLGVVFATYGDYYFTPWGFILTLIGTLLAAMKTVATNMILVGRLKLHPLDLLIRMSPLAFVQCVFASWWTGELARVRDFGASQMHTPKYIGLVVNGAMAFFLNVVSFTANKKTSALTMTVAANVKQVLTIVLAVVIFHLHITRTNFFGISLTLLGGAVYARVEYMAKLAKPNSSPAIGSPVRENFSSNKVYQQYAGHVPPPAMQGGAKVPLSPLPTDINEKRYYEKQ